MLFDYILPSLLIFAKVVECSSSSIDDSKYNYFAPLTRNYFKKSLRILHAIGPLADAKLATPGPKDPEAGSSYDLKQAQSILNAINNIADKKVVHGAYKLLPKDVRMEICFLKFMNSVMNIMHPFFSKEQRSNYKVPLPMDDYDRIILKSEQDNDALALELLENMVDQVNGRSFEQVIVMFEVYIDRSVGETRLFDAKFISAIVPKTFEPFLMSFQLVSMEEVGQSWFILYAKKSYRESWESKKLSQKTPFIRQVPSGVAKKPLNNIIVADDLISFIKLVFDGDIFKIPATVLEVVDEKLQSEFIIRHMVGKNYKFFETLPTLTDSWFLVCSYMTTCLPTQTNPPSSHLFDLNFDSSIPKFAIARHKSVRSVIDQFYRMVGKLESKSKISSYYLMAIDADQSQFLTEIFGMGFSNSATIAHFKMVKKMTVDERLTRKKRTVALYALQNLSIADKAYFQ